MANPPTWDDLDAHQQQAILDEHRDINVHDDWWDCVEEMFKEDMAAKGVRVERMYFSGFWSQGDGACFDGFVEDWALALQAVDCTHAEVVRQAVDRPWQFGCRHSGHYYHSHCTSFDSDMLLENPYDEEDDELRHAAWEAMFIAQPVDLDTLHDDLKAWFRRCMDDLYSQLEDEHDHLTSDESVKDSLDGNGMLDDLIAEALADEAETS